MFIPLAIWIENVRNNCTLSDPINYFVLKQIRKYQINWFNCYGQFSRLREIDNNLTWQPTVTKMWVCVEGMESLLFAETTWKLKNLPKRGKEVIIVPLKLDSVLSLSLFVKIISQFVIGHILTQTSSTFSLFFFSGPQKLKVTLK